MTAMKTQSDLYTMQQIMTIWLNLFSKRIVFERNNKLLLRQNTSWFGVREARTLDLRISQMLWDLRASQLRHHPMIKVLTFNYFIGFVVSTDGPWPMGSPTKKGKKVI
jgi:hypothetical protein